MTTEIAPGFWGYKLVVDGDQWLLDPEQGYRKYVGSEENSAVRVHDCNMPRLSTTSSSVTRAAAGSGTFTAQIAFERALSDAALDPNALTATLRHGTSSAPVSDGISADAASGTIDVNLTGLADGKYTLALVAKDAEGIESPPLRLVFWVEEEAFDWRDALIYMIVTDRYKDGDPASNAPKNPNVQDPRADFQGGDLEGVRQKIADGTLDALGVRAIWLTPFQTNPDGDYLASDNFHNVTGYHG